MSSAEWSHAYCAVSLVGVQERLTRASPLQMIQGFRLRATLRYNARSSVSQRLAAAASGKVKMTTLRSNRLLSILEQPIRHRDVVVHALKQRLPVPPVVLAEYPGLALRTYGATRVPGQ